MFNREYLDEKEALNVEVKLSKTKKQTFVLQVSQFLACNGYSEVLSLKFDMVIISVSSAFLLSIVTFFQIVLQSLRRDQG